MNSSLRALLVIVVLALITAAFYYFGESEDRPDGDGSGGGTVAEEQGGRKVEEGARVAGLEDHQLKLIDRAFAAVSAMPIDPHIKNRSRSQQEVVDTCFELGQPALALSYADRIDNWRRHDAHADYAYHCAERGDVETAREYLARAEAGAREMAENRTEQEWRVNQVRARIAATYVLLDDRKSASRWAAGVTGREASAFIEVNARLMKPEDFDRRLEDARVVFENGDFDQLRVAFAGLAEMYRRFHDDEARRARIAAALEEGCQKIPVQAAFEAYEGLAVHAIDAGLEEDADSYLARLQSFLDEASFRPEDRCAHAGRLARLRAENGDVEAARAQVKKNLAFYDENRDSIVNIYRAGALRPLAEACVAMGDGAMADRLYLRALEEGFVNPNSRPRSQDLCTTLLSMALLGHEPNATVTGLIQQVYDALGPPW